MNPDRDHLVAARTLLAQARRLINDASRAQLDAHRHVPGLAAGDAQRERMAHASSLVLELVRELDAMLPDPRIVAPAPRVVSQIVSDPAKHVHGGHVNGGALCGSGTKPNPAKCLGCADIARDAEQNARRS